MVRTIKGPGMLRSRNPFRSVLSVGPFFQFFQYKIGFVWSWLRFLCDFVCSYALLFFRTNFVSFFRTRASPKGVNVAKPP